MNTKPTWQTKQAHRCECRGNISPNPEKKGDLSTPKRYASSKLFVEKQIAAYQDWTEESILARRGEIETWTLQRWHVDMPDRELDDSRNLTAQEKFRANAIRLGNLDEFERLVQAAEKFPLYKRMQKNWGGISFTPIKNKTKCLIWIGPDLWVDVFGSGFERYFGIPANEVKAIIGDDMNMHRLGKDDVDVFISRMDRLLERIEEIRL
jgi:hypothetical protein